MGLHDDPGFGKGPPALSLFVLDPEVIFSHEGLKIGPKHSDLLGRLGDVPAIPFEGLNDKSLFHILDGPLP